MSKPDYEVAYHWTRGTRTGWTTVGHAFINEGDGPGDHRIKICLSALPVPGTETEPGELTLFPRGTKKDPK